MVEVSSPASPEALVDRLRLHLATLYHPGLGRALVERHGGRLDALLRPLVALRQTPGLSRAVAEALVSPSVASQAAGEVRRAVAEGVRLIAWDDPRYPAALRLLDGMPLILYVRGAVEALADPEGCGSLAAGVGIVGSRRPTPYGRRQARILAAGVARRGLRVISGLAAGIDGEAHRAALECGGSTVAVLGSGLGRIYPREHEELARRMVESRRGVLLTELPFDAPPRSFHFPLRNRILSGLSDAVLVIEAGEKSGSLITARHALDQGKTVYVVPGRISPESMGGLRLLCDGASPVLGPEDVLPGQGLPGSSDPGVPSRFSEPSGGAGSGAAGTTLPRLDGPLASRLDALFREEESWHPDRIADRLRIPAGEVLAELARLELDGCLARLPGGLYALTTGC